MSNKKDYKTAAFICGLLGLILCFTGFVGLALSIVGLILAVKTEEKSDMRTAGLVLSIIGLVVSAIITVWMIIALVFIGGILSLASTYGTIQ